MRGALLIRRVAVDLDLAPQLPPANGDRIQLQHVLMNLVMNCGDAMEDEAVDRRVLVRTALNGGGEIVTVCDNGLHFALRERSEHTRLGS